MLAATMLFAASLPACDGGRSLYRPLARTCAAVADLGLGAARPAPLVLGRTFALLLWSLAVVRRLRID